MISKEDFIKALEKVSTLLALCKRIWLRKQMTEVTYKPTLRPETSLPNLEMALSESVTDNGFELLAMFIAFVKCFWSRWQGNTEPWAVESDSRNK